jgi:hypothetical protein
MQQNDRAPSTGSRACFNIVQTTALHIYELPLRRVASFDDTGNHQRRDGAHRQDQHEADQHGTEKNHSG